MICFPRTLSSEQVDSENGTQENCYRKGKDEQMLLIVDTNSERVKNQTQAIQPMEEYRCHKEYFADLDEGDPEKATKSS
jgi:hypothetical protein